MKTVAPVAVILAGGKGSRMRAARTAVDLTPAQHAMAMSGYKCLMPDSRGRPFLEHVLHSLSAAGIEEAVLVVGEDHDVFLDFVAKRCSATPKVTLTVQKTPRGTADAVLAARNSVAGRPFMALNADNLYPIGALQALTCLEGCGLVAFHREGLLASGSIPESRISAFALIHLDQDGYLSDLIEKPSSTEVAVAGADTMVSMNLWRGDETLFEACRDVPLSLRGEFELPEAVMLAVSRGIVFRAATSYDEVLDLSQQSDVKKVADLLGGRTLQS